MPKVTRSPAVARPAACATASWNAARSLMTWSAGNSSIKGSSPFAVSSRAATAAAGAVLRPNGSRMTRFGSNPAPASSSVTRSWWATFATISGLANSSPSSRSRVALTMVLSSTRGRNCFGRSDRDAGQSRVPAPPDIKTGTSLGCTVTMRNVSVHRPTTKGPSPRPGSSGLLSTLRVLLCSRADRRLRPGNRHVRTR